MGAKIIKGYDLDSKPLFGAGPDGLWDVYNATKDDSSKQPATAFVLSKSQVETKKKVAKGSDLYSFLKREAQQLVKLKHPMILSMVEPLVENKDNTCGFVTEPVVGNLAYLIEQQNWQELCSSELELKIHLLELFEAIAFLHNDARTVHNAINPSSVYLTSEGKWKLAGFAFSCGLGSSGQVDAHHIDINASPTVWVLPPVNYMAPDMIADSVRVSPSTDIYSLGCLVFALFSCLKNKKHEDFIGKTSIGLIANSVKEKLKDERLLQKRLEVVPHHFREIVAQMLSLSESRPSIGSISQSPYFYDPFIQVIKNIGKLKELEFHQQQTFLNSLCKIIIKFERKVIVSKLVPALNELMTFNPQLSPPIIQVFIILMKQPESYTKADVLQLFWPKIKALCSGKEMPAKTLYLLILHVSLFVQFLAKDDLQNVFLPLLYKCFECGVQKIQALAIRKTEVLFDSLEAQLIKSQIIPRLFAMCLDPSRENRKWALLVVLKRAESLDRKTVSDQLMTVVDKVRKLENDAEINLIVLKIFQAVAPNLETDQIANRLLCSMVPMLLDINLNKSEFVLYFDTIQKLLKRIQDERLSAFAASGSSSTPTVEINEANTDAADEASLLPSSSESNDPNDSLFDFLNMFGGGVSPNQPRQPESVPQKPDYNFSNFTVDQTIGASNQGGDLNKQIPSNSFSDFSKQFNQNPPLKPSGAPSNSSNQLGGAFDNPKNEFESLDSLIGGNSPPKKPAPLKFGGKGGLKPPPRTEPLAGPEPATGYTEGALDLLSATQNGGMDFSIGSKTNASFPKPVSTTIKTYGGNPGASAGLNQPSLPFGASISASASKPQLQMKKPQAPVNFQAKNTQSFGKTNNADSLLSIGAIPSGNATKIDAAFSGIDFDLGSSSAPPQVGPQPDIDLFSGMEISQPPNPIKQPNQLQMNLNYQVPAKNSIETDWGLENEFADYLQEKSSSNMGFNTKQVSPPFGKGVIGASQPLGPVGSSGMFSNMKTMKKPENKPGFGVQPAQAPKNIDLNSFFDNI